MSKLDQSKNFLDSTLNYLMHNPNGQPIAGGMAGLGAGYLTGQLYNQVASTPFMAPPVAPAIPRYMGSTSKGVEATWL